MPNPPVPFIVRKLRGNPGKRAMRQPPEPALLPKCPPEWLHEYPKQEWGRTAPELHAGLITERPEKPWPVSVLALASPSRRAG